MSAQENAPAGASGGGDHGKVPVWVLDDEFYPWFFLVKVEDSLGHRIEVDPETLTRWSEALSKAEKVQDEIAKAVGWHS